MKKENSIVLQKYMPKEATLLIAEWIEKHACKFKICKSRKSKFGDYRHPLPTDPVHRISVNGDLNPFAFLLTTVHEFAHLETYIQFKNRVKPHGNEWKNNFQRLMQPFLKMQVFPMDIVLALQKYLKNPAASSCNDLQLFKILSSYNQLQEKELLVEHLPLNTLFEFRNKVFERGELRRTRIKCRELSSNKFYLFSPLAAVKLVN